MPTDQESPSFSHAHAGCRRQAMNTLFEVVVVGDDAEHGTAAAAAALEEIQRIERLLSRFDPASEVSRLNREAVHGPVLIDYEFLDILRVCRDGWEQTCGRFDITALSALTTTEDITFSAVAIDADNRTVEFSHPGVQLDFGAFGKGYALDRAAALLRRYGVTQALLHGGTSSVLALGHGADGAPWRVGVRDLRSEPGDAAIAQIGLCDMALSTSVVSDQNGVCDIVDPVGRVLLRQPAGCLVITDTAARAEVYSTALLGMGAAAAQQYCRRRPAADLRVGWIAANNGQPSLCWLTGPYE